MGQDQVPVSGKFPFIKGPENTFLTKNFTSRPPWVMEQYAGLCLDSVLFLLLLACLIAR